MRKNNGSERPSETFVSRHAGKYAECGRQMTAIVEPDDEEEYERRHTPRERGTNPRDLTKIFGTY